MTDHAGLQTPFVIDVKMLRERARKHIESGAVTGGLRRRRQDRLPNSQ